MVESQAESKPNHKVDALILSTWAQGEGQDERNNLAHDDS